jgi:protein-S-isoprenylcysteine O-methyltransferase Ste14
MRAIRVIVANVILSALVIAAAALVLAADRLWPFQLPRQLVPLGWPLLIAGTLFITLSVATFVAVAHASGAVGDAPKRLVTAGPFHYMRNPIYVGAALLLFAIALYRQSPSFLLVGVVFVAGIDAYVRRVEEPRLKVRFGREYVEYKRVAPRWIPRWPRRKRLS